jgi:hypothetical protein
MSDHSYGRQLRAGCKSDVEQPPIKRERSAVAHKHECHGYHALVLIHKELGDLFNA